VPTMNTVLRRALNLARAVSSHIADGMQVLSDEQYQARLDTCNGCPMRDGKVCTHEDCGCIISRKAYWKSSYCPLNKWEIL
jgi:hypothetical protein